MKKIISLLSFLLLIFILTSCQQKNLTKYHLVNDTWEDSEDEIAYSFKYVKVEKNGAYLKIERKNEFRCNDDEIDDKIYVYSYPRSFDYISENGIKGEQKTILVLGFLVGYYTFGKDNVAEIYIHSALEKFNGYLYTDVHSELNGLDILHVIYINLY